LVFQVASYQRVKVTTFMAKSKADIQRRRSPRTGESVGVDEPIADEYLG
jgi:hypothetical protein